MHTHILVHSFTHMHAVTHILLCTHIHTLIHSHMDTNTCTHTLPHSPTHAIHTNTSTSLQTWIHSLVLLTHIHSHTHPQLTPDSRTRHTQMQPTHTYIHTHNPPSCKNPHLDASTHTFTIASTQSSTHTWTLKPICTWQLHSHWLHACVHTPAQHMNPVQPLTANVDWNSRLQHHSHIHSKTCLQWTLQQRDTCYLWTLLLSTDWLSMFCDQLMPAEGAQWTGKSQKFPSITWQTLLT